jgi:hypothetical protein
MPKIDIDKIQIDVSTGYPPPFNKAVEGRSRKRLGRAAGLDHFGVNICTLKPGAASSQRHWHEKEDELVYVLEGEVVLCEDDGETVLKPGDAAAWKAGVSEWPLPGQPLGVRRRLHRSRYSRCGRARPLFRYRHDGRAWRKGCAVHEEKRRAVLGGDSDGQFQT